ncbi:MAG: hypothetical protein AAB491_01130 [Patescibacteria group bacterium]
MEKLKEYKYIIILILLMLGFTFYWFQLRPSQIRKECSTHLTGLPSRAPSSSGGLFAALGSNSGEEAYKKCLAGNGLKK